MCYFWCCLCLQRVFARTREHSVDEEVSTGVLCSVQHDLYLLCMLAFDHAGKRHLSSAVPHHCHSVTCGPSALHHGTHHAEHDNKCC